MKSYSEHASSPSSGRFCKPSLGDTVKRKKSGTKFSITLCGSTKTHHPLETKIAKELLQSMTVSVFRFSAAQVRWSQPELDQLQSLLTHAYKRAEYLHNGTASDIFVFPKKWVGEELSTTINIIAQELCNNIRRCLVVLLVGVGMGKNHFFQHTEHLPNEVQRCLAPVKNCL